MGRLLSGTEAQMLRLHPRGGVRQKIEVLTKWKTARAEMWCRRAAAVDDGAAGGVACWWRGVLWWWFRAWRCDLRGLGFRVWRAQGVTDEGALR